MELPNLSNTFDSWGPGSQIPTALQFNQVPYAPFSKGDKLGRAADWAADLKDSKDMRKQQYGNRYRDPYHAYGASAASSFFSNTEDSEGTSSFSVVDSTKPAQKARPQHAVLKRGGGGPVFQGGQGSGAAGPAGSNAQMSGNKGLGGKNMGGPGSGPSQGAAGHGHQQGSQGGHRGQGGHRAGGSNVWGRKNWRDWDKPQRHREPSVKIGNDWELIQTNGFSELQKLSFEFRPGTDVETYGFVYPYNRQFDKNQINAKLEPMDRSVYNPTTSEDPIMTKIAEGAAEGVNAQYFATDAIISLLMCATKSVNPWDIVINKRDGKVFFDKREGGPLDFVSVDENSFDPPVVDERDAKSGAGSTAGGASGANAANSATVGKPGANINSAGSLAIEATYINQNFMANAVIESAANKKTMDHPQNPFHDEDDKTIPAPLAHGYRYRKFNLAEDPEGEPLNLIIRTEVDAVQDAPAGSPQQQQYVTVRALNEYGGTSGVLEWKNKFVNARGAIVAAEMKNNLCKLSRWTVQSMLAGASVMKIGFVSRTNVKDNKSHTIVGVLGREPVQFSGQLNLNMYNGWGIVRSIINISSELDDGKYVLLKDPNSPAIKLYRVPQNAFE